MVNDFIGILDIIKNKKNDFFYQIFDCRKHLKISNVLRLKINLKSTSLVNRMYVNWDLKTVISCFCHQIGKQDSLPTIH